MNRPSAASRVGPASRSSDRPSARFSPSAKVGEFLVGRRFLYAVIATWAVVVTELVVVALANRSRIASVWELQHGVLWLLPTLLGTTGVIALAAAALWAIAAWGETRWARGFLAASAGVFAIAVGWGLGGGRHLSGVLTRSAFALALASIAAAAAYAVAPLLARGLRRNPLRIALAAGAAILLLELLNRFLLVRLYPAFHAGLAALALLAAPPLALAVSEEVSSGARVAPNSRAPRLRLLAVGLLLVAAIATARPAAARLAYFDNFRLLLLEQGPILGQAVKLAARLAPPAPPPAQEGCDPAAAPGSATACVVTATSGQRAIDWRGRDLLLITIDALRADHMGAYGYKRPTTPRLDALAKESVVFERAYSATPHTSYAITSLMTGKYMRPLLLQGAGADSDTWAALLRAYGYRTAAFYPPAVFFIDPGRFAGFQEKQLGFEFAKVEFAEGDRRVAQVADYLKGASDDHPLFLWVHLFGPHEPYEAQPGHAFGDRDIDRYDSEVAAADATAGRLIDLVRQRRPHAVVIVSADHGEEFGDHGGRYHGTTVYEEQVRVPLLISAGDGLPAGARRGEPVQTIDLLPTVLSALDVPRPPRMRGRDLGELLVGKKPEGQGFAHAETEEQALLAQGSLRLVCDRRLGACRLYDLAKDPAQQTDAASDLPDRMRQLRDRLHELAASHGRYELSGLRAEGRGWPAPILRGASGDADAAEEIAVLLEDADLGIRRKAAELLFELARPETAPGLRLALGRDEDADVRRWCAIALTRLGQGAPLVYELVDDPELRWRRFAALALAEAGDKRGAGTLIAWWQDEKARDYVRSRQLLSALAILKHKDSVWPLIQSLGDVRLRPYIADTLAAIGEEGARGSLAKALASERYQGARVAIVKALVRLGGEYELAEPLVRFLGVPDPLPDGLAAARDAKILEYIGGPERRALARLHRHQNLGVALNLYVPKGGNGRGVRALFRTRATGPEPGFIYLGARLDAVKYNSKGEPIKTRDIPKIDLKRSVKVRAPAGPALAQVHAVLPPEVGARPGRAFQVVVVADRNVELDALALVPLADELPPPPPKPWSPGAENSGTTELPSSAIEGARGSR